MRLGGRRESSNIESQRGSGGGGFNFPGGGGGGGGGFPFGGGGKMGCGTLGIIVVAALIFGVNPMQLLEGTGGLAPQQQTGQVSQGPAVQSETDRFVAQVLATTEDSWGEIFRQNGQTYPQPTLVFYAGRGQSGCGAAQSAMGPFYCPSDNKIYLDTSFFDELAKRFGAPGDFAAAYVIAHEVGHHIQHVTGTLDDVRRAQSAAGGTAQSNALQVRVELQADCYAGVWGNRNKALLEEGDLDEAFTAASAIGDDRLQREAQGYVVPDSFTHGSSAQRKRWFQRGYESGNPASCDTFSGAV